MSTEFLAAFLLGFAGSLHCLGMCGPIALIVPPVGNGLNGRVLGGLIYSAGRLTSYTVLGLIIGLIGSGFALFNWQQNLSIALGILIILSVITPFLFKPMGIQQVGYRLTHKVKRLLGKNLKKNSVPGVLTIGIANGLLPCGLVFLALAGAAALADILKGGLFMMAFGLGTVPMMTGIYLAGDRLHKYRPKLRKVLPVITVAFGLFFVIRGLGLGIPFLSPEIEQHGSTTHCAPTMSQSNVTEIPNER